MNDKFCGFKFIDIDGNKKEIEMKNLDNLLASFISVKDNKSKLTLEMKNISSLDLKKLDICILGKNLQQLYPEKFDTVLDVVNNNIENLLVVEGINGKLIDNWSKETIRETYLKTFILEENSIIRQDKINGFGLSTGNQERWNLSLKNKGESVNKSEVSNLDSQNLNIAKTIFKINDNKIVKDKIANKERG